MGTIQDQPAPKRVFISYSSEDRGSADHVCTLLEREGLHCWIAPRDVTPGREFGEEIVRGIEAAEAMVVLLSSHSNDSIYVRREVERATSKGKIVVSFRIENVQPSRGLELFIAANQWVDGWKPPLGDRVKVLADALKRLTGADVLRTPERRPARRASVRLLLVLGALLPSLGVAAFVLWRSTVAPDRPTAPLPPIERELTYSILVQKYRGGVPFQDPFLLSGEINFESDYRIRLVISSPQPGHLYVLNEGPSTVGGMPDLNVLFPSTTANAGSSFIASGREVRIPDERWFVFDAQQGTEKIWLIWSADSVGILEEVKELANPQAKGVIAEPRQVRQVSEFLALCQSRANPSVRRDEVARRTIVEADGSVLAYAMTLEHH